MANIGQRSRQMMVFFLHRKVFLANDGETFDNMLHPRQQENQHLSFGLEGKTKCKHLDSPSGATDGYYSISKKQEFELTCGLGSEGPPEGSNKNEIMLDRVLFRSGRRLRELL
jgi:hypothetical protein